MTTLAIVLASVFLCVAIGLPPGILAGKNDRFESARAFGASPGQILRRVELPLATPTTLAGLNQTIMLSLSMVVIDAGGLGPVGQAERLFVLSGNNVQRHATATVLSMLRRERVSGTAIGAICSGAHVLARAGFLNGIEAAVHWA
jgi:ABC-type proline/glycine betaine transport system permease subunit